MKILQDVDNTSPSRHTRCLRVVGLWVFASLVWACAPQKLVFLNPNSICSETCKIDQNALGKSPASYTETLNRWTREGIITVIQELSTTLRVHATLFSHEYQRAYLAKHLSMYKLSPSKFIELRDQLFAETASHYVVTLVAATHDASWNDFDKQSSQWNLALINDQQRQSDVSKITHVRRIMASHRALYPSCAEPFHQLYQVSFPKVLPDGTPLVTPKTRKLVLSLSGPLGQTELVWHLHP